MAASLACSPRPRFLIQMGAMRTSFAISVGTLLVLLSVSACGDETSDPKDDDGPLQTASSSSSSGSAEPGSSSSSSSSSSSGAPAETCTATFVWLQKDAYKEVGGRTTGA